MKMTIINDTSTNLVKPSIRQKMRSFNFVQKIGQTAGEVALSIFFAPVCNRLHNADDFKKMQVKGKANKEARHEKDS